MASTATATRRRKSNKAPAIPIGALFETDDRLADMPTEYQECYGDRHPFVWEHDEFVMRGPVPIQQLSYLRCPDCTMGAIDTYDIARTDSGRHVLRRACARKYLPPDGYGVVGGRVDHDVMVTYRLVKRNPALAEMMAGVR